MNRHFAQDSGRCQDLIAKFSKLSQRVLLQARQGVSESQFLSHVTRMVFTSDDCDAIELWLCREQPALDQGTKPRERVFRYESQNDSDARCTEISETDRLSDLESTCRDIVLGRPARLRPTDARMWSADDTASGSHVAPSIFHRDHHTVLLTPIMFDTMLVGLLVRKQCGDCRITPETIATYEHLAPILGMALQVRCSQRALEERVKELTCLRELARILENPKTSKETALHDIANMLPRALQYPDFACACVILDEHSACTSGFEKRLHEQIATIVIDGQRRGSVVVGYTEDPPTMGEAPFLKEERDLLELVAREVGDTFERRETQFTKSNLERQVRHADRLATIGQLSAGIAHELNEPLGAILGFAELLKEAPDVPETAQVDISKIADAALHAREVIKQLLIFSRQLPGNCRSVNLNTIVHHALSLVSARCTKKGIKLERELSPHSLVVAGDQAQIQQVLLNLLVNAIDAIDADGCLAVRTLKRDDSVILIVEDNGVGMSPETQDRMFVPFFTTKDVGKGTGLGLAVVHGIVTAHAGTIHVDSEAGRGTRVEVGFPLATSHLEPPQ